MPIGAFARSSGLTASALRFYADSGVIRPARVDDVSGYRYYSAAQLDRAVAIRRMRDMGMPLGAVAEVLDADAEDRAQLIDEHVARLTEEAHRVRREAAAVKASLAAVPWLPVAAVKGPVLAAAVEQILTATAHEPGIPLLGGLHAEVSAEALTLTATDRYRLCTRTLVPDQVDGRDWAATLSGDDLRAAVPEIRRWHLVRVEASPHGVRLRAQDRHDQHCRIMAGGFPDHRQLLASLAVASTRVTVAREALLRVLEGHEDSCIRLRVTPTGATLGLPGADSRLAALVSGEPIEVWFHLTTLYPAIATAIGPDVMLDLRGPEQPVTIRSADSGDLTTLAMPVRQSALQETAPKGALP